MNHPHVIKALQNELWAITPAALQTIVAVAQGFGDPEAVSAKLGKPLTNAHDVTVRDSTAIIPIVGPIMRYANLFSMISGATSIQTLATDLQTALDDPNIKSIILEINSPGGQIDGVAAFADQVRAANSIKPVIAYISQLGASAAYWIASAAGVIVANKTSEIGSIGVVMQASIEDDDGTVKFISAQSPLKQADPSSDQGKTTYQERVDQLADVFISSVADNRGINAETVQKNYGGGAVLIASTALNAGMIDKIGTLESVLADLASKKSTLTHKRGQTMSSVTRETLATDHPELLAALLEEGKATGMIEGQKLGAEAERARIQGIEAIAMPGHDALIASLKYDGITSAEQAALKILAAEKTTRADMAAKLLADTPKPVQHSTHALTDNADNQGTDLKGQAKWEHEWRCSEPLQAEFKTVGAYVAFKKADESGLVKRLGVK